MQAPRSNSRIRSLRIESILVYLDSIHSKTEYCNFNPPMSQSADLSLLDCHPLPRSICSQFCVSGPIAKLRPFILMYKPSPLRHPPSLQNQSREVYAFHSVSKTQKSHPCIYGVRFLSGYSYPVPLLYRRYLPHSVRGKYRM